MSRVITFMEVVEVVNSPRVYATVELRRVGDDGVEQGQHHPAGNLLVGAYAPARRRCYPSLPSVILTF